MRALVTGANGLIGRHLVAALLARGHQVRALLREPVIPTAANDAVDYVMGDVVSGAGLEAACDGMDRVFHTAAYFAYAGRTQAELIDTAVTGTENLLRAAASQAVGRVIVTSSSVVYGCSASPQALNEDAPLAEFSEIPYVLAKIKQHRTALQLAAALELDIVLACPTIVVGPTQSRLGPSNGVIVSYLADPARCTFPGGCNIVAAEDVAGGHLILAEHGRSGKSYLLGADNLSWRQIHSLIANLAGVSEPRFELNHTSAYLAAAAEELRAWLGNRLPYSTREQASMIGRHYWYDCDRARALGFQPASSELALLQALSWLVASRHVDRETRAGLRLSKAVYAFRLAQRL